MSNTFTLVWIWMDPEVKGGFGRLKAGACGFQGYNKTCARGWQFHAKAGMEWRAIGHWEQVA